MMQNGILSIKDPHGKYMGMQLTARNYLRGVDIDISFMGPKEKPTTVVLALSSIADRDKKNPPTTYTRPITSKTPLWIRSVPC